MSDRDDATRISIPGPQGGDLPFATIVETINDGILVCRMDGEIVYANISMASMLGYEQNEMVGKTLFDFMTEEWAQRARDNLARRSEGVAEMFDHQFAHRNGGGLWSLVSAKPMREADGSQWGSLVAIQDISTRKEMEEELRQARDELERRVAERTEQLVEINARLQREVEERTEAEQRALEASRAKSAFLANMSHELRTPLNAVIGYTELIQEDLSHGIDALDLASVARDLSKVHASANHLLSLINDILDLSKVEAGKMELFNESFDLGHLVQEVVDTIDPLARKSENHIELANHYHGDLVADRTKLKQVLLNLMSNAVKFTDKGSIRLVTSPTTIHGSAGVCLEVTDSGMGISSDKIERLFQPFTQADESTTRRHGGTGLGLTICKRFCEMMGGTIEVESEPGEGTTFRVKIPSADPAGLNESSNVVWRPDFERGALAPDAPRGPRVLIIDDDPNVHELIHRILAPRGFQLISAYSGDQGLELAREQLPDVITLDVMMPGRDGWSVLSTLKSQSGLEHIPVVMVSMIDDRNIGFALGATDYLVKPIQRDRLLKTLSRFHPEEGASALVVEDEPAIREMISRHLRNAGWRVEAAENGRKALELLDEERPDVVILDLMMPEMDGFEVAELMRQEPRWRDIPIVVVTAMDLDAAETARLRRSVSRILSKNVRSIEEVMTEVMDVIGLSTTSTKVRI
ncbi:PAS domain-containing hybrid sensor histidine kinase/response regulator [Lujinxingia sediminis]|uniref:histidine kinase n=1 Tax=Lujinxingia sediminis TaxID=2480984 RepID=A0ABY0CR84_9DELT|nr:response regulator [Lujinxingia sediminis]RVU42591.1 PAS domain-containing hybrid sensor histidine kinase/response regulator [Lujinxingia sediminis]